MPLKAKYGTEVDLFRTPNKVLEEEEMLLEDSESTRKYRKENSKITV